MKPMLFYLSLCFLSFSQENIVIIEFNNGSEDIFGSWPINRKWHALLIDKLERLQAKKIVYDFDFKYSDNRYKESDQLLFEKISNNKSVYIQSNSVEKDSAIILGNKKINKSSTYNPFINYRIIDNDIVKYETNNNDLLNKWTDDKTLYLKLHALDIKKLDALQFLKSDSLNYLIANKTVFVGSNIEGVSSYFALSTLGNTSTTELRALIYKNILTNNLIYKLSDWFIILLFPIFLFVVNIRTQLKVPYGLLITCLSALLFLLDFLILSIIFKFVLLLLNILLWAFIFKQQKLKITKPEMLRTDINLKNSNEEEEKNYNQVSETDYSYINKYKIENIIVSKSSPLIPILKKVELISNKDISVLIYGESGTGKELIANLIHKLSNRSNSSFFAVNCAALSETLLESELFGHESGAFTGASKRKVGRFEHANGGTIFLDEIAETSLNFQVKLLRVLQEKYIERVGSNEKIAIDVRVIAASNKNIDDLIAEGKFREDLYYRLNGIELKIPALRDRSKDIATLCRFFLNNDDIILSDDTVSYLKMQYWNGNVRELKTAVERAKINSENAKRDYVIPSDFELKGKIQVNKLNKGELADKILNLYKALDFKHRASSEIADELGIHRVTVSEYLKAWILYYYNQADKDLDKAVKLLSVNKLSAEKSDKLRKKITETIKSIKIKLKRFETENISFEQGTKLYFKSFPSIFHDELKKLL